MNLNKAGMEKRIEICTGIRKERTREKITRDEEARGRERRERKEKSKNAVYLGSKAISVGVRKKLYARILCT